MIKITKEIKEVGLEGEKLGLITDEVAFYNVLETNDGIISAWADCKSVLFQMPTGTGKTTFVCEIRKFILLQGERGVDGNKK